MTPLLGDLLLVSAYIPPQSAMLDADLSSVFHSTRSVILADDLKHRVWGSRLINTNGGRWRGTPIPTVSKLLVQPSPLTITDSETPIQTY